MRRLSAVCLAAVLALGTASLVTAKGNPHRQVAAILPGSITLTMSDCVFGGTAHASAPGAGGLGLIFGIQAETGGQAGQMLLDANGEGDIGCGPTPSWSSGGGSGFAEVVEYDLTDGSLFTIVSDTVPFTVQ